MPWRVAAYRALRPLLFTVDAEAIHHATLRALALAGRSPAGRGVLRFMAGAPAEPNGVNAMGLRFRNRIGLAAGFDKDAMALPGWAALGFGFAEVGTVTPEPQPGQPRPRLFRLSVDEALINRMGFNNAGASALGTRLADVRAQLPPGFVVGVNLGRGRDTPPRRSTDDYLSGLEAVAGVADYVAINVSSPNTPGLRGLQDPDRLSRLLERLTVNAGNLPLVVKLAPDLRASALERLVVAICACGARGVILTNTTVRRPALRSPEPLLAEAGGLSGRPLLPGMLAAVARARQVAGPGLAVIASGGISSPSDARSALTAGADLVQIWTGLVYRGPGLIGELVKAC